MRMGSEGTMFGVLPAKGVKIMARRAKRFRFIILETGVATPRIAEALRLPPKTVRDWREGYEAIPAAVFEVIEAAFQRERENDRFYSQDERGFLDFIPIYARAARLPDCRGE